MLESHAWEIMTTVIILMGSINIYFIQKLIIKIDESSESTKELKKDFSHLSERVKELADMSARLHILEKQIAVFEFVLSQKENSE